MRPARRGGGQGRLSRGELIGGSRILELGVVEGVGVGMDGRNCYFDVFLFED